MDLCNIIYNKIQYKISIKPMYTIYLKHHIQSDYILYILVFNFKLLN